MAQRSPTDSRRPTFTEQARRAQLIDVTIDLVATHGYAGTSLARIAAGAAITKAAVLYHFASKDAVVQAAYEQVLSALVSDVGAAVDSAIESDGAAKAPAAYIRSMVDHLHRHPRHTRMIIEALGAGASDDDRRARRQPLADLLAAAADGSAADRWEPLAVMVSGAIDGIVTEQLADPSFDGAGAADQLVEFVELTLARRRE